MMWSPTRSVSSIELEGILKACITKVLIRSAIASAITIASTASLRKCFPFRPAATLPGVFSVRSSSGIDYLPTPLSELSDLENRQKCLQDRIIQRAELEEYLSQ